MCVHACNNCPATVTYLQVQDAIHAPHINWMSCTDNNVYVNTTTGRGINDQSIPSTLSVLPNVIEKSVRTVIVHGLAVRFAFSPIMMSINSQYVLQDFILISEGTRIAIQYA